MESRVSYAAVGVFVLVLTAALIGVALWLGSDVSVQRYDRYSIYFRESVAGLYMNAPVKYQGVVVGRVERIQLAEENPELVHVVAAIQEGTPVKTDTRATLDPQGVTGVVHIELTGGSREAPLLVSEGGRPYPVIESEPSLFNRLDQALTQGLQTLDRLAGQVSGVLNDENQQNLSQTLANLAQFSQTLAANSDRLAQTLENAERLTDSGAKAAAALPDTLAEVRETLDRWQALAERLEAVGVKVEGMAETGQRELNQIGRTTIPEANALITELRRLTENLDRLSEDLRENPRMLLFGRPRGEPGPGE
jgi:phospholipid/cholesterol/gamma-HCH transport system substrate-binding protein